MNEFIKIDKQKMAYARWLDLQIVLKDLGAGDE